MPATALKRDDLESLLRTRKLDHTLAAAIRPLEADPCCQVPTGLAALDARLGGGFPRGHISEIAGARSSGRLAVAVSAMMGATARGEAVALIDPLDMFDPVSASAGGIDFRRVLWIRGDAVGAARASLSAEYGTLQKNLDRAIKALNLVLQAGGFGLVVLDLAEIAPHVIRRLPYTTWLRLHRIFEGSETACVLIGSEPVTRTSGGVTVLLEPDITCRPAVSARVLRPRAINTDNDVRVSLSAPAC
jgi:recombination protein RecA